MGDSPKNKAASSDLPGKIIDYFFDFLNRPAEFRLETIQRLEEKWRQRALELYSSQASRLERKLSDGEEAISLLFRAIKLMELPNEKLENENLIELARQHFEKKDYAQAFQLFQRAVVNERPSLDDLCLAGTSALHLGKLDYAEEYADQALMTNPMEVRAIMLKGLALYKQENLEASLPFFEKAKKLEPSSNTAIKYYNEVEKRLKNPMSPNAPKVISLATENETHSQDSDVVSMMKFKRRWIRKPVSEEIIINDHSQMCAFTCKLKSLSGGGALIEGADLPEEFDFHMNLGRFGEVYGVAKKIYAAGGQVGVKFQGLSPSQEDSINQRVIAGHC